MKSRYALGLTLLTGVAIGAFAMHGLHAQSKPPVYQVSLIDVKDADGYVKNYAPKVRDAIKSGGGRVIAVSMKVTPVEGDAPKSRVAIAQWDSVEKFEAYRNTAAFKEARKTGDQYATFTAFLVEGLSP